MKVAVLLAGNIRTLDQCKENIINAFKFLEPDYFVSTYDNQLQYHHCIQNSLGVFSDTTLTENQIIEAYKDFNPKEILIDSQNFAQQIYAEKSGNFKVEMLADSSSHFLQYWKVKRGLNLIKKYENENDIKYDIIIKTRCDLLLKDLSIIDFSKINDQVIVGGINSPVLNDQLIITSNDTMNQIIDYMLNEFYTFTNCKSNISMPHGLLEGAIDNTRLELKKYDISDCLLRETGVRNIIQ
jgi:hypothetical protein